MEKKKKSKKHIPSVALIFFARSQLLGCPMYVSKSPSSRGAVLIFKKILMLSKFLVSLEPIYSNNANHWK